MNGDVVDELTEWRGVLEGRRGKRCRLEVKESLIRGRATGIFTMDDVPEHGAVLTDTMKAFWLGVFESWAAGKKKEEEGISLEVLAKQMSALRALAQATASKVESMRPYEKEVRRTPIEERMCFKCGELGHLAAHCPRKKEEEDISLEVLAKQM
jgi:hypothetical protein